MSNTSAKRIALLNSSSLSRPLLLLGTASALLGTGTAAQAFDANSLPQGGNVTGGSATIATSGNTLTVNQSSNRAVIDWRSFDIGANAQANFNQPGSGSIAVNRVNASTDPTRIDGGLHANGQVWIINPNGVMFGKTARVDAAGVVATTANIDDKAFMAGSNKLQMTGGDSGEVVNEGHISVGEGGLAAFVAPSVRNAGTIRARVGRVALAAGDTYTLDLAGDRLVEIGLGAGKAVVDQSGKIVNAGGTITISAKAAGQVVDSLINVSGVTSASSVKTAGGQVILGGDDITIASTAKTTADGTSGGQISAVANKTGNYAGSYSAQGSTGDGGQIETSGKTVTVASNATINASSAHGKAGKWTLDPLDVTITSGANDGTVTGGTVTTGTIEHSLAGGTSVEITTDQTGTDNGDLTLAASINAASTGNAGLTLTGRHLSATGGSTVSITGGALTLNVNTVNTTATPGSTWIADAVGMIGAVTGGTTIHLGAGTYAAGTTLNKANLTLDGGHDAIISVGAGQTGLTIGANNITVENLEIAGPVAGDYDTLTWTEPSSSGTGIVVTGNVSTGENAFDIANNNIHDIRTGIIVQGASASGSITGNRVENTKGGILIQYNDGSPYTITGNYQDAVGNEWGIVVNLNTSGIDTAGAAPLSAQQNLLTLANANGGMAAMDRHYAQANRTRVVVDAASTATAADDGGYGNGLGNARQALSTIQAGLDAVVAGGTVNVDAGTYNESILLDKANVTLHSVVQHGAIIDAGGGATAVSVSTAANLGTITIDGFTIQGWTSRGIDQDYNGWTADTAALNVTNNIVYGPATGATAHGNGIEVSGNGSKVIGNQVYNVHLNSTDWSGSGIIAVNGSNMAIQNNVVDGADTGIAVTNWNNTAGMSGIAVGGNTVSHASEAISIQTNEGEAFGVPSGSISDVSITGNTVTDNQSGIGVWDYSDAHNAGWSTTISDIGGNTFTNNATQISTDFTGADVTPLLANNTFDKTVVNQNLVPTATNGELTSAIYGQLQKAIDDASAGDALKASAGVFDEALSITKNVDIEGAGVGQTIIRPTALLDTGTAHKYDTDVKTAVFVNGASDVNISGLTIDGNNLGANAVVFWNNASGSISNALIENAMPFSGAQTGQGLAVDATGANTTDLTLNGVQFVNWNKNAIDAVNGDGATTGGGNISLTVNGGSFTGQGPTGANEQNGIVLWERAGGTINATVDGASFSNIDYTGTDSNATGILLYGSTTGSLTVKNSTFDGSVQKYIGTDGGTSVAVDATSGNAFGGVAVSSATSLDQIFAIQDKIADGLVDAGNSLVRLVNGHVYVTAANGSIQTGINLASAGDTVNVQAGNYAGGLTMATNGLTLAGQSGAKINVVNGQDGIHIAANNDTVTGLEIAGPATVSYLTYNWGSDITRGISVANGVQKFTITNNDIHGTRNDILVDGRNTTGTITGNVIDNSKSGISIQYTDGTGIAITGNSEGPFGNEWGENLHLNGNTQGGTYHSGTASASVQAGLLADSAANGGWTVQDQAYVNSNRTAVTVSTTGSDANQGSALSSLASIQAGINAVVSGGTVNVLDGTYVIASGYINVNKSLNLVGQSEDGVIIDARNASTYGLRVTASNGPVSLSDFTLYGVTAANGYGLKAEATQGLTLTDITSQGAAKSEFDLNGVIGGTLTGLTANGASVATGQSTAGNGISLTDSQNITITGSTTENNQWGGLALYQGTTYGDLQLTGITVSGNSFTEANGIYAQDQSNVTDFGTINLNGQGIQYVSTVPTGGSDGTYYYFQQTQQGAIDQAAASAAGTVQGFVNGGVAGNNVFTVGIATNGTAMSINTALDAASTGSTINVLNGTYAQDVALTAPRTVNFGNVSLNSLSSSVDGAVLSGTVRAGSVSLNGATTLGGDLSLDTSAANGPLSVAAVDGGFGLTLASGTGTVSLGDLGATTRLGAVAVSGPASLTGSTYDAASFDFGGDVTLTAANTGIDTTQPGGGGITFGGAIFGTSDGAQSLTLASGSGDIVMNNAGTTGTRLGALTVSGNNFTALTVDIAGDFTSALTGNQVFAADTLNAGGNVTSNVGGDAVGHIVAQGAVGLTVTGDVSGNISGSDLTVASGSVTDATLAAANGVAINSGNVTGASITAPVVAVAANSFSGTVAASDRANIQANAIAGNFSGGTVTLASTGALNAVVNVDTLVVNGGSGGNVSGSWSSISTGAANSQINPQQLVVEGFALPAGTRVAANGQLILPAGTVIGLLSPGGGPSRVIMVNDVQTLGQLLADGYVAIVIDLNAKKSGTVRLASN